MTAAPASELDRFLDGELAKDAPPAPPPAPAPDAPPAPQPLMSFRRAIPPVDTIAIGDEIHVLKSWPTMATGMQTGVINDRNAQLALRTRMERGEELTADEQRLHDFYLRRILRVAVPTIPDWCFLAPEEGGMLPTDREVLVNLFFTRSNEVSDLLNAQQRPLTSDGSSPGSSASTAAIPAAGSGSAGSGSTSTRRRSAR
jgi:hypothetical protein